MVLLSSCSMGMVKPFLANSLKIAKIIGYLTDACQILLLFAEMKTNRKAKAKRVMKASYTQLSFDL